MANKIYMYLFLILGIMMLMNLAGVPAPSAHIFNAIFNSPETLSQFTQTQIYGFLFVAIGLLAGISAIVVGFFGKNVIDIPISATIALSLILFIGDYISLVTYTYNIANWAGYVVFLILAPLVFGFMIAIWDWIRGKD